MSKVERATTDKNGERPRRTQQERTATTRARVLNATIEHLAEFGYGRTTTVEVAERAGVSRGALVHHFPTRSDLVLSALEYLCELRLAELEHAIADLSKAEDHLSAFVDLVWTTFNGPLFAAQLELWIAARTDPDLYAGLYPLERGFGKRLNQLCADALGADPASGYFYEITKHLMRGMAVERILKSDEGERLAVLEHWKQTAKTLVRRPAGGNRRNRG